MDRPGTLNTAVFPGSRAGSMGASARSWPQGDALRGAGPLASAPALTGLAHCYNFDVTHAHLMQP